jgi:hypothetical protein
MAGAGWWSCHLSGLLAMTEEDAPMVGRRAVATLAVLLAAAFVPGCAKTVTGRGTLAEDAVRPGGGGPTSTEPPSSSGSPSVSPTGPGSSPAGDGTNEVCQALEKDAVEKAFGASVSLEDSQTTGCQIAAENGNSMIVAVFDFLTLAEYKRGSFTELTVAGHPGVRTNSNIIYVGRSQSPSDEGLLAAYFSGLGTDGERIATAVLELLLGKFSK